MFNPLRKIICLMALTASIHAAPQTAHFALQMENHSNHDTYISLQPGIGNVYFDIPLEDHTLLKAYGISRTYGVNFAPNDPHSSFNIQFDDEGGECIFTVGYFTPPEEPIVSIHGNPCNTAGYKMDYRSYPMLVLFI